MYDYVGSLLLTQLLCQQFYIALAQTFESEDR
jgi:hypothetical protein